MRFRVLHVTTYEYNRAVRLGPHWLRLRPRGDDGGRLLDYELEVDPSPVGRNDSLDAEGNLATRVWFDGQATRLQVTSRFELRTGRPDAYDFLPDAFGWNAPYDPALSARLRPWIEAAAPAAEVRALGDELRAGTDDAHQFLRRLNERLFNDIEREIRDTGAAHAPEATLRLRRGACRDLAVLFVAVCRSQGLAARFVSGYQAGPAARRGSPQTPAGVPPSRRHMHAWPEVYLPGGGWRGFDPTHGLAVADAHVALAAAAHADDAAPVDGHFFGDARSHLTTTLHIDVDA